MRRNDQVSTIGFFGDYSGLHGSKRGIATRGKRFAEKRGWNLAMELKYGGGALEDREAEEWQYVVNRELQRLAEKLKALGISLQTMSRSTPPKVAVTTPISTATIAGRV